MKDENKPRAQLIGELGELRRRIAALEAVQAEHQQVESTFHLQTTALQAAANAIVMTNREGDITWANPAFTRLTGYGLDEVLGQNPRLFKSGFQGESFYQDLWATILSGQVWHGEVINRRKDDTLYTEEMTITPVRDRQGEISHFIAVKQDVTRRKRAEEQMAIFRRFVEAAGQGFGMGTFEGKIVYANAALCRILGVDKPEDVVGRSFLSFYPQEMRQQLQTEILPTVQQEGQGWSGELALVSTGGRTVPTHETFFTIGDAEGVPLYIADVISDITELKEAEAVLRERAADLERANTLIAALSRVAVRVQATLDSAQIMEAMGDELSRLGIKYYLALVDPRDQALVIRYTSIESNVLALAEKLAGHLTHGFRIQRNRLPIYDELIKRGRPQFIQQVLQLVDSMLPGIPRRVRKRIVRLVGIDSNVPAIYLPLSAEEQVIGTLAVWGENLREEDISALSIFAGQVASALKATQLYEQAQEEIGERKRAEEELTRHRDHLDKLVQERTAELGKTVEQLLFEIDERKQAEESLRESEQKYSAIFDKAPFALALTKMPAGITMSVNDAFLKLFEFTQAEVVGKTSVDLGIAEPDSPAQVAAELQAHGYVRDFVCTRTTKSGHRRILSLNLDWVSIGREQHILTTIRDITEHRRAEESLRASEERYRRTLDDMLEGCQIIGFDWSYLYVNDAAARHGRQTKENMLGRTMMEVYPGMERTEMFGFLHRCMAQRQPHRMENEFTFADGSKSWFELSIQPVPEGVFVLSMDVTERTQAERALRESEERYRTLAEAAQDIIFIIGSDAKMRYINSSGAQTLRRSPDNVMGQPLKALFPPDIAERLMGHLRWIFQNGELVTSEDQIPFERGELWFSTVLVPLRDAAGMVDAVLGIARDITQHRQMQDALRQSEARFRGIVESSPDGIVLADPAGRILMCNPQIARLLGYPHEDALLGRSLFEFFVPEDVPRAKENLRWRIQADELGLVEYQLLRRDGSPVPIDLNARVLHDASGSTIGYMAVIRDITDRKRAEETLRITQFSVDHAGEATFWTTPDARFHYVNEAACHSLGYSRKDLLSMTVFDIDSGLTPEAWADQWRGLKQRGSLTTETRHRTKDGRLFPVEVVINHFEFGGQEYHCVFARDITERKQAEEILIQERASLARRVAERTAELSAANAELARAARLKDEFLASMSHELRTPLNAILGMSEALQEEVYGPLTDRQFRSLHTIEESGRHLLSLINDILDVSKIEADRLELEIGPVSIEPVCQAGLGLIRQIAHKKRLRVSFVRDSAVTVIQADERRLKQILVNLLSNAVKFTPEGGEIGLEVVGDAEGEVVHFIVWDAGIGIAAEEMDRLFQPFVQLDSSLSRQHAGTGLGLVLVRRLTEMHGGGVSLESEVGQGSRVTVSLPWRAVPGLAPAGVEGEAREAARERVGGLPGFQRAVVVEDSTVVASQLARYLAELGVETIIHPHGLGTVDKVLEVAPDVIILDILLPDLPGWDVLRELKAEPRTRDIPVLIVSVVDDRSRGRDQGAAAYLVKPISRRQLQEALQQVLAGDAAKPRALVVSGEPASPDKRFLILLAEDNEDSLRAVSDYLLDKGYRVAVARNGLEAIELAREEKPDLILMDIQMPGMDGLEATRRIRAGADAEMGLSTGLARVPIIALTALAMPGDRERCLEAGANDYLSKPVSLKGLVRAIEALLHQEENDGNTGKW